MNPLDKEVCSCLPIHPPLSLEKQHKYLKRYFSEEIRIMFVSSPFTHVTIRIKRGYTPPAHKTFLRDYDSNI